MNEYLFRLKKIMEVKKISEAAFSRMLGIQPSTMNSLFLRNGIPKSDLSRKIADEFKINLHWLLTGEGPMYQDKPGFPKPEKLPLLSGHITDNPEENGAFVVPMLEQSVSAGQGSHLEDNDTIAGYIALPPSIKSHGSGLAALPVRGDSMYPTIDNGDMVVCDRGGYDGEGIYVIRVDNLAQVKRLLKKPGGVMVISDNAKYPTYEVFKEVPLDVVGRVRAIVKVIKG